MSEIISYSFTWRAQPTACRECSGLNGQVFEDQDIFQSRLYSTIWGDCWDLDNDRPLTHGNTGINCMCGLEVDVHFDWTKLRELVDIERS